MKIYSLLKKPTTWHFEVMIKVVKYVCITRVPGFIQVLLPIGPSCIFVPRDGQIFMHCVSFEYNESYMCSGKVSWKESFTRIEHCVHEQINQEVINCKYYVTWMVIVHW